MENKIFIADLAEGLARRKSISKKDAESFVRTVFDAIQEQLLAGEQVKIKGFGTFKVITVESRESVNVSTGERFVIDSHGKISFTPDKTLADHVNKPFAGFETVILHDSTKTEDMERVDEAPVAEEPVVEAPAPEKKVEAPAPEKKVEAPAKLEPKVEKPVEKKPEPKVEKPVAEVKPVEEKKPEPKVEKKAEPVKVVEKPKAEPVKPAVKAEEPKSKWWLWCLILVLVIGCAVWYMNSKPAEQEPVQTEEVEETVVETPAEPVKSAEELAADYEQVANGEYWIVGTKTTHVLEKNEDLTKLSLQYYGDKKLINYIIRHNGYSAQKASNLFVGTEVKIPELVKRD